MAAWFFMLAQDEEGIGKLIVPIIFFVVWILSAISGALGKRQKEKERRRRLEEAVTRQRQEAERRQREPQAPKPPPVRPKPSRPAPTRTIPRDTPRPTRVATPTPPPPRVAPRPPVVPMETARPAPRPSLATRPAAEAATQPIGSPPMARKAHPIRNLLTPKSLRQQIVVMEILGKPLALRDEP